MFVITAPVRQVQTFKPPPSHSATRPETGQLGLLFFYHFFFFNQNLILVESRSWRDRNLKFGPNCDLEVDNLEKKLIFFYFSGK